MAHSGGTFGSYFQSSCAGGGVQRKNFAPRGGEIHHAVDDEWRGFLSAMRVEIEVPGQAELRRCCGR